MESSKSPSEVEKSSSASPAPQKPMIRVSKQWVVPPRPKPGRKPALDALGRRKAPIKPRPGPTSALSVEEAKFRVREKQYQDTIGKLQKENNELLEQLEMLQAQLKNSTLDSPKEVEVNSEVVKPDSATTENENRYVNQYNYPVEPPCAKNAVYTEIPIELDPHAFLGDSAKRIRVDSDSKDAKSVPSENGRIRVSMSPQNEINFTPENPAVMEKIRKRGVCNSVEGCLYSGSPKSVKRVRESEETKVYAQLLIDLHKSSKSAPMLKAGPSIAFKLPTMEPNFNDVRPDRKSVV